MLHFFAVHYLVRIKELRTLVANEKASAVRLSDTFVDQFLKTKAKHIADDADMISSMFLGSNLERWQPEEMERKSLNRTAQMISIFLTQPREFLEEILRTLGADAETAGGKGYAYTEPVRRVEAILEDGKF